MEILSRLLQAMRDNNATDLLLNSRSAPFLRVDGRLKPLEMKPLSAAQLERMLPLMMSEEQLAAFRRNPEANLAVSAPGIGRFRINAYRQRGEVALAIRAIPTTVPTFQELGLPEGLSQVSMLRRGLVVIAGPAGAGKTTTLASLIAYRADHDTAHIITVEDPIEYEIPATRSVVSQREVGKDTLSYENALTNALRQSPDVLAIGEARHVTALEHALEFADTGHLCLTTIHANTTTQTFERMINLFGEEEREQVLLCMAHNVKAILFQNLLPSESGGRVLAWELLMMTPRLQELVRKGAFWELYEAARKSPSGGLQTFDDTLYTLYGEGLISEETALEHAHSDNDLRLRMKLSSTGPQQAPPRQAM